MFKVVVSPQVAEDLLEIKNYIENELQNPIAAKKTVKKIVETYEGLKECPDVGISVERYVSFPTNYKFVLANNYSIFYRLEGKNVKVVRIIYSRRDFVRILFGENESA